MLPKWWFLKVIPDTFKNGCLRTPWRILTEFLTLLPADNSVQSWSIVKVLKNSAAKTERAIVNVFTDAGDSIVFKTLSECVPFCNWNRLQTRNTARWSGVPLELAESRPDQPCLHSRVFMFFQTVALPCFTSKINGKALWKWLELKMDPNVLCTV